MHNRLAERLNESRIKLPLVDPFLEIRRGHDTVEQAAVGAAFPPGSHKSGALAEPMGGDEEAFQQLTPDAEAETAAIEEELPSGEGSSPFKDSKRPRRVRLLFGRRAFHCRHHARLVGNPCKGNGLPEHGCLASGHTADPVVERGSPSRG